MAAYAALLSLMRIIEKLHLHPHPPPISLQKKQIDSLTAKIRFLEEFLEAYNPLLGYSAEADPLETRIADAAYAAEDVIESNIVDRITNVWPENICSYSVYLGLAKVIQDMASIQKEAMDITETMRLQLHQPTESTPRESLRSTSIAHNSRSIVGVDDVLLQIKDKLTSHSRHLQIIPIVGMGGSAEIWCMPHIRHVVDDGFHINERCLPDPPSGSQNDIVLENLHTLEGIIDFKCSEEAVKRIPNVRKLGMSYKTVDGWSCLDNLVSLHKLVSLDCCFLEKIPNSRQSINFPQLLKKLKLRLVTSDCWEDILEKIGSLPFLEKLRLTGGCFEEGKWETVEGQFQSLKYLHIWDPLNLKQWTMESSHFPRLERLELSLLTKLEEIPLQVAEIPTLGSIQVYRCSESVAISTRRIVEEQEKKSEAMESLASHRNIHVEIW